MRTMLAALLLTGCATMTEGQPEIIPEPAGDCRNEALATFVGRKATAELGAEMLKASGARVLRWGPPGAMMTMDFRPDRLTVAYDRAMTVTAARCG